MGALERTVRSAGVSMDDLSSVLLVGGASRIPLVAEMVREATGRPVAVDTHPKHAVAMGAALYDGDSGAPFGSPSAVVVETDDRTSMEYAVVADEPIVIAPEEPPPAGDPAPAATEEPMLPGAAPIPEAPQPEPEPPASAAADPAPTTNRRRWLLIVAAIVAIAAIAIAGGYLWTRGSDDPPEATSPDTTLAEESVSVGVVPSPDRVAAVYQVGYRGPDSDDSWGEWAADGRNPPEDIASDFYPVLGPYSSTDPAALQTHFEMMGASSIRVVAVLWRGPDSIDDAALPIVLDEAARQDRSVAFVLEVLSPEAIHGQVEYLLGTYGEHPALLTPTDASPWTDGSGMLVMVVGLEALEETETVDIGAWRAALDDIHQTDVGATVLAVSQDPAWVVDAHFDGLVNGPSEIDGSIGFSWASDLPERAWFVPIVSPGWSSDWSGEPEPATLRGDGSHYVDQWMAATTAPRAPNLVTILSFNAWSAGTQIEPADPGFSRPDGSAYRDYTPLDPHGYLDLTTEAVGRWTQP